MGRLALALILGVICVQPSTAKEIDCNWQSTGFTCRVAEAHAGYLIKPAEDLKPPAEIVRLVTQTVHGSEIDAGLVLAVIAAESAFDNQAISRRKAMGLMQLTPETIARFGIRNPFDAEENIRAGTSYLKFLVKKFGNLKLALAAYNAGEAAIIAYGSVPPFEETTEYVDRVLRFYERYRPMYSEQSEPSQPSFTRAREERRCGLICRGNF
jgi:soluble lytic murein transglycosylase-like protein